MYHEARNAANEWVAQFSWKTQIFTETAKQILDTSIFLKALLSVYLDNENKG